MTMPEEAASRILTVAVAEGRAGELLDCLFDGGTATVDAISEQLILLPGNLLDFIGIAGDDDDENVVRCGPVGCPPIETVELGMSEMYVTVIEAFLSAFPATTTEQIIVAEMARALLNSRLNAGIVWVRDDT